jgi:hypothetical protein
LEAAEADLIDAYVRGEMMASDRPAFERHFLTSSAWRSKVEFARALAVVAAESNGSGVAPRRWFWGWLVPLRLATGLAALGLFAASCWLAFDNAALRSRLTALEAKWRGSETEQAAAPSPIAFLVLMPGVS